MTAHTYATPDDIDVSSMWPRFRRSLSKVIVASLIVGGLTFAILSMVAPKFESEAQLSIVARSSGNPFSAPRQDSSVSESVAVRMDKEAINTHVRAIRSTDLATKVVNELNLKELPEFNSALGATDMLGSMLRMFGIGVPPKNQSVEDRVLNAYFDRLNVYSPKESRFIVISFQSIDPELASKVANTLAAKYRSAMANLTVVENDEVLGKLSPEINRLIEEVKSAQAEVEKFRGEANLFKGGQNATSLNQQQLAELTAEHSRAKADLSRAEARMRSARDMYRSGAADALADVQRSPIIQNLVQQRVGVERQISELSATLLPGHPRMKQLYADLRGIKRQVKSEVGKVVESLEKEAKVAALREQSIANSLAELKAKVVDTGPDEVKLAALEAVAKSKRAELERVQAQYEAAKARAKSGAVPVEAQIISRARTASVPSSPKKVQFALLAMFATLLFGLAGSILGLLWGGARSGPQHRMAPAAPSLAGSTLAAAPSLAPRPAPVAAVPVQPETSLSFEPAPAVNPIPSGHTTVAADEPHSLAPTLDDAVSSTAEIASLAELAGRIEANNGATGYRTLITSDIVNHVAHDEALGLASELAEQARSSVIVIDWSPSVAGMSAYLGLAPAPGLNDLFSGTVSFQDVIQVVPNSTVHFIATGTINGAPELDPDKINLILDALDEAYNNILVVAPQDDARTLFEVIEGRFDAGVTVSEAQKGGVSVIQDPPGTFLGFQVADIDLIKLTRKSADTAMQGSALLRTVRGVTRPGVNKG